MYGVLSIKNRMLGNMFITKAILRVIIQGRSQEETTTETKDPKGVARARERPTKAGVCRGVEGMPPPPPRNFEIQTLGNAISSVLRAFW